MSTTNTILIIADLSAGLFTGLLMPTLAFSQRALKDLSASSEFTVAMQLFLGIVPASAQLRARDGVDAGADRGAGRLARERESRRLCS